MLPPPMHTAENSILRELHFQKLYIYPDITEKKCLDAKLYGIMNELRSIIGSRDEEKLAAMVAAPPPVLYDPNMLLRLSN